MWKCPSRTLRATLKRSVLRSSAVLSTKVPPNKDLHCFLKFTPGLIEQCNRIYNYYRGYCDNSSKEKKDREGPKEKKTSFLGGFDNNFFDALKWSGAFFLGYYFLQPFGYKRKFSCPDVFEDLKSSNKTICHETLLYLFNAVQLKPYNCVLPEVQAAKTRNSTESSESNTKGDSIKFAGLENAHQKVLGALNNWLGNQYIQSGRHKEALECFMQSAEEEYAAGIYNLGICHERGLGTTRNLPRAAELYKKAADLGHATAMYNLGVFYAQGLGGMELNIDHARTLFRAAANLGQRDAARALNLEKQEDVPENVTVCNNKSQKGSTLDDFIFDNLLNQTASNTPGHFDICDDVKNSYFEYPDGKEIQSSLGSDSGVLDLSPHNESSVSIV